VIAREDSVGDTPVPRAAARTAPHADSIAAAIEDVDDDIVDEDNGILELEDEQSAPAASVSAEPAGIETAAPLVSPQSADAARQSLEALSAAVTPAVAGPVEEQALPMGTTTVDALVREALRPMLKQWLDANLPEMVESMVAREIARITGKRF
jgi:cell pole-organizing protein PopZ